MKNYVLIILVLFLSVLANAQEKVSNQNILSKLKIFEKKTDKFNVYFNFQSSFDAVGENDNEWEANFKTRQLRLEIKGNITDKIFYRFRQRLNRSNTAESLDNLSRATDMMYVGYHFNDKVTIIGGKQCLAWGSFEFHRNAVKAYEYYPFLDNLNSYMVGASVIVKPLKKQQIQLQVTNSKNKKPREEQERLQKQDIEITKTPLTGLLRWKGSFFNNQFQTSWAYVLQNQAKNKYSKMINIGNKISLKQFQIAVDYLMAKEDIDGLGIATKLGKSYLSSVNKTFFEDVTYSTIITRIEVQPTENWNIFFKGVYGNTAVKNIDKYDKFRTTYGYHAGVEYLPFKEEQLRLFLAYAGRKYKYNDQLPEFKEYTSNHITAGISYRIKAF